MSTLPYGLRNKGPLPFRHCIRTLQWRCGFERLLRSQNWYTRTYSVLPGFFWIVGPAALIFIESQVKGYRQARPNMYNLGVQAAGGRVGTPTGSDTSSRAMQRLKDMYARNLPTHECDRPPQPQGVKQLLQVSSDCSVLRSHVACSGMTSNVQATLLP